MYIYAFHTFAYTCEMTNIIQLTSNLLMISIQYQRNLKTLPV